MFNRIKWLINKHKQTVRQNSYRAGYDYAAGCLLRLEEIPSSLANRTAYSVDPFDKGINDAIDRLIALKVVKDNRSF